MCNCINLYRFTYPIFKELAFKLDAEQAHHLAINSMKVFGPLMPNRPTDSRFHLTSMGLHFTGPIGLAAGLDKNAEVIPFMASLPFGFIEIGTVTPKAQPGNEMPRLFRYEKEESLRNKMGFNNDGSEVILQNLQKANRRNKLIGVNLGKNKSTANEEAHLDYAYLYQKFAPLADYLVINVSSPNTPGLRDLLKDSGLKKIIEAILIEKNKINKPLLVKVSPDMALEELSSVVGLVNEYRLEGIIATNTTIMPERGEGGVSGRLLSKKAKETRDYLLKEMKYTQSKSELIAVGGISSFNDLLELWRSGGKLAQIYSAFIFQGPNLLYDVEAQLIREFSKRGVKNFDEFLDSLKF